MGFLYAWLIFYRRETSIPEWTFPKSSARRAYVPDKEFELLAMQIKENNNI